MDIIYISPSTIAGTIVCPPSKSVSQRAAAAALLNRGTSIISNYGESEDEKTAIKIIEKLGAQVQYLHPNTIQIDSTNVFQNDTTIHCGESGLSLRMFAIIAAISNSSITIDAAPPLKRRPIDEIFHLYDQLGVIYNKNKQWPIQFQGPIKAKNINIDGSMSSQYLSGLLISLGYLYNYNLINEPINIVVKDLKSKPYIDLTLEVMEHFQSHLPQHNNYKNFHFEPNHSKVISNKPIHYNIEGDWSSAAFLLVAAAIHGSLKLEGMNMFTQQADKAILLPLQQADVHMSISMESIKIAESSIQPFTFFDATDCPDLFPALAALAACSDGMSAIRGVHRLYHKESNRAIALQTEFQKAGIEIKIQDDDMIIYGTSNIKAAQFHSHHDHRIAMACSLIALKADGTSTITDASAVSKSYPHFFDDLKRLGALIH